VRLPETAQGRQYAASLRASISNIAWILVSHRRCLWDLTLWLRSSGTLDVVTRQLGDFSNVVAARREAIGDEQLTIVIVATSSIRLARKLDQFLEVVLVPDCAQKAVGQ